MQTRKALKALSKGEIDYEGKIGPLAKHADRLIKRYEDNQVNVKTAQNRHSVAAAMPVLEAARAKASKALGDSILPDDTYIVSRFDAFSVLKSASKKDLSDQGLRNMSLHVERLWHKDPLGAFTVGTLSNLRNHYQQSFSRSRVAEVIDTDIPKVSFNTLPIANLVRVASQISSQEDYNVAIARHGIGGDDPKHVRARIFIRALLNHKEAMDEELWKQQVEENPEKFKELNKLEDRPLPGEPGGTKQMGLTEPGYKASKVRGSDIAARVAARINKTAQAVETADEWAKFIPFPTEGVKRMSEGYQKMVGSFRGMSLQMIMQDEYGQDLIAAVAVSADPDTKMILFKALEDSGYVSKESAEKEKIEVADLGVDGTGMLPVSAGLQKAASTGAGFKLKAQDSDKEGVMPSDQPIEFSTPGTPSQQDYKFMVDAAVAYSKHPEIAALLNQLGVDATSPNATQDLYTRLSEDVESVYPILQKIEAISNQMEMDEMKGKPSQYMVARKIAQKEGQFDVPGVYQEEEVMQSATDAVQYAQSNPQVAELVQKMGIDVRLPDAVDQIRNMVSQNPEYGSILQQIDQLIGQQVMQEEKAATKAAFRQVLALFEDTDLEEWEDISGDDIESNEDIKYKYSKTFSKMRTRRGTFRTKVSVIGTRYGMEDMYSYFRDVQKIPVIHHRALEDDQTTWLYCPNYTLDDLLIEREKDVAAFETSMNNNPIPSSGIFFKSEDWKTVDPIDCATCKIIHSPLLHETNIQYYCAIDPARGMSDSADNTAILIIAIWKGKAYIVDGYIGKADTDKILSEYDHFYSKYPLVWTLVEKTFAQIDLNRFNKYRGIIPYTDTVKRAKYMRIDAMKPYYTDGMIIALNGIQPYAFIYNEYLSYNQTESTASRKDDGIDCLSMIIQQAGQYLEKYVETQFDYSEIDSFHLNIEG